MFNSIACKFNHLDNIIDLFINLFWIRELACMHVNIKIIDDLLIDIDVRKKDKKNLILFFY